MPIGRMTPEEFEIIETNVKRQADLMYEESTDIRMSGRRTAIKPGFATDESGYAPDITVALWNRLLQPAPTADFDAQLYTSIATNMPARHVHIRAVCFGEEVVIDPCYLQYSKNKNQAPVLVARAQELGAVLLNREVPGEFHDLWHKAGKISPKQTRDWPRN